MPTIEVDQRSWDQAKGRFTSLAGMSADEANEAVRAAMQAVVEQMLETISGSGPVPSAMTAARADVLRYLCLKMHRTLTPPEVGILYRTTPAAARAILTTMSAVYAEQLHDVFLEDMRRSADVATVGNKDEGLRWRFSFPYEGAYDLIRSELARLKLLDCVTLDDRARAVEFAKADDARLNIRTKLSI